ncbi:MAG: hypothetical protein ACXIUM_13090 [Wenzhouxiangella sp.]
MTWPLLCCLAVLMVACSSNGSSEFEQLSYRYFGCFMTPPWPVELNSADAEGATFLRTDDIQSSPLFFSRSKLPIWELLPNVVPESIQFFDHPRFEVAEFIEFYSDPTIEFDRQATVIRRNSFNLFLPGETGKSWRALVETCVFDEVAG